MLIPLANDFRTVMELSHVGGPLVGVGAFVGAILGYVNADEASQSEAARHGLVGGAVLTLIAVLVANGTLS